ncbi:hypothetical protein AVEN_75751-1, partial [Araneus ventricosus]
MARLGDVENDPSFLVVSGITGINTGSQYSNG